MILHLRKSRWKKCTTQRFSLLMTGASLVSKKAARHDCVSFENARCSRDQILLDLDLGVAAIVSSLHPPRPFEPVRMY